MTSEKTFLIKVFAYVAITLLTFMISFPTMLAWDAVKDEFSLPDLGYWETVAALWLLSVLSICLQGLGRDMAYQQGVRDGRAKK